MEAEKSSVIEAWPITYRISRERLAAGYAVVFDEEGHGREGMVLMTLFRENIELTVSSGMAGAVPSSPAHVAGHLPLAQMRGEQAGRFSTDAFTRSENVRGRHVDVSA